MVSFRIAVATDNSGTFVVFQIKNIVAYCACRRCNNTYRLFPGSHTIDEYVVDVLIFDSVQFVYEGTMNIQSVQLVAI